ncbi:DUF4911 domain-containing protein [Desulfovibrio ferrophilus]|uniref:DUF4911 domain-containing protein n=1 Tax=Desulfovibrio ferrophilus TaxID=241368 RepID=A0A2Z6B002_9BACT|nr:DUF4911 domain-containing protein [Desulfovibrio ferrophilus]BBD08798.1 uncharacterized protein DFE_2072 [Desulfovibrio ferrophilus]
MVRRRRIGKAKSAQYARDAVKPHDSRRIYLRIAPSDIAFFKFILESYDNLAYLSVVDKHTAVLQLVHTAGTERETREFLETMRDEVPFTEITLPSRTTGEA